MWTYRNSPFAFVLLSEVLFDGTIKTRSDNILLWVGRVGGMILALSIVTERHLTSHIPAFLNNNLGFIMIAGLFLYSIGFISLGIRYVGRSKNRATFSSQAQITFGKIFLYLFLPALILTLGALVWAYATNQPIFSGQYPH